MQTRHRLAAAADTIALMAEPTPFKAPSPWPGRLAGGCFVVSLPMLGLVAGVLVATRVLTTSAMGWDQLADALGGGIVGALLGLVTGALLVRRLGTRRRLVLALLALAGALLCLLYVRATPPRVAPAPAPPTATRAGTPVRAATR